MASSTDSIGGVFDLIGSFLRLEGRFFRDVSLLDLLYDSCVTVELLPFEPLDWVVMAERSESLDERAVLLRA
jgi:hypothetical protein